MRFVPIGGPGHSLGVITPLVFVLIAGVIVILSGVSMTAVYGLWPHKSAHLLASVLGFELLVLCFLVWVFAVGRGWTLPSTAAGFVVSATGLALHATVDLMLSLAWRSPNEHIGDEGVDQLVTLSRQGGLGALLVGLMLVLGACLAERRLRNARPAPEDRRRLVADHLRRVRRWPEAF